MKVIESSRPNQPVRIAVYESRQIRMIEIHEILYCEASRNYTFIYLTNGSKCVTCRTLAVVRNLLQPQGFVPIHKSYLVNGEYIKTITTGHDTKLILSNNQRLKVARRMKPSVMRFLFT